ncbi:glycosyltransferase family 2 protein [Dyella lipolytica]|uniref:Glycosyltransferase n=1 Tax=Dyella lipolytica TaxID=1867835 RepID=A0ABW8IQR6_9GAMM|nr:glycosyltransferase [Dyella lipolytica]
MGLVHHYPALKRLQTPTCSVCIANYNGDALLVDCLDSVLAQQGSDCIEIIVHDDASTDGSVRLLREKYPQVELLVSAENVGFCVSNNRMANHARGEYILLLNNDAALYNDALSTLLENARKQHAPGILTLPQYDWITGALVDRGCLLDPFYNPVPNLDPERHDVAMAIGACLFLSRKLWIDLEGFPDWFQSIGEDMYLCCLARLQGLPVQVTSSSGYRHRQGISFGGNRVSSGTLQTSFRRRQLSERNKCSTLLICTPTAIVWPLWLLHQLLLLLEGGILTFLKHDRRIWLEIYWPTLKHVHAAMPALKARRRQVQSKRQATLTDYLSAFASAPQKLRLLLRHGFPTIR